jgi:hypothetical protein
MRRGSNRALHISGKVPLRAGLHAKWYTPAMSNTRLMKFRHKLESNNVPIFKYCTYRIEFNDNGCRGKCSILWVYNPEEWNNDRLCGLGSELLDTDPNVSGSITHYQIFWVPVDMEWGPFSLVRSYFKEKVVVPVYKTEINGRRELPRSPHDTPLSAKIATKIRGSAAIAQSVQFACGLKAMKFVLLSCLKN